jgi:long-subunit fatty acid transport protein
LKRVCRLSPCSLVALAGLVCSPAFAQIQINSSPNPTGSGARALGMGAAFIAIADDATAASWNPGGLTQLERPELSLVYAWKSYGEDLRSWTHPEMESENEVKLDELNYASFVYPVRRTIAGRNIVLSLNYISQYDFDRDLRTGIHESLGNLGGSRSLSTSRLDYSQRGQLASISPAIAFELTDTLSVGAVWNIYDHNLVPSNEWKNRRTERRATWINGTFVGPSFFARADDYDNFEGSNLTFGALWKPNSRWGVGAVYHTSFDADVDYYTRSLTFSPPVNRISRSKREITYTFPDALGVGLSYRFPNDKLTLSLDVTRRNWDKFVIDDPDNISYLRKRRSGVSNQPLIFAPKFDPTYTVRLGAEYVFVDEKAPVQNFLPSLRAGVFYDPEPSSGMKDSFWDLGGIRASRGTGEVEDYYGVSLGLGLLMYDRVNVDIAYVYRWADEARKDTLGFAGTDFAVDQHLLYLSTVIYF